MFSRRRSLFDFSRGRLTKAPRRQKRRGRKQRDLIGIQSKLSVERLEDRVLLAVDVFVDNVTGFVTIMDESGFGELVGVQEDNDVTLSLGNFDPDGGQAAAAQDGLLITDPDGVNAITIGIFQVSPTQAFVPQNFDFDGGVGSNIQDVLTTTIVVDLQDGDDDLTFSDDINDVPVVTNYKLHGGSNGSFSDVFHINGEAGVDDDVTISRVAGDTTQQIIQGLTASPTLGGFEEITFTGQDTDNDDLTVVLGTTTATARLQVAEAGAPTIADELVSSTLPTIEFANVDVFEFSSGGPSTATVELDGLIGANTYTFNSVDDDTLIVTGIAAADTITASVDGNGDLQVSDGVDTINTLNMDEDDVLRVETLGGDDTLIVEVGGTPLIDTPIFFDGGTGADELIVQGTPTQDVTEVSYFPGLQIDEGRLEYEAVRLPANPIGGALPEVVMTIDFDNLEPVVDLVPAPILNVFGNGGNNAMTYTGGSVATRGLVSIDGFERIEFANKTGLALSALEGDDTLVADNSDLPAGLQTVELNGQEGNDTVRFESLPDETTTTFTGASADGGSGDDVIVGSAITVPTSLNLIGGAGNDTLQGGAAIDGLVGGDGDDTIIDSPNDDVINPGAGNDTLLVQGTILADLISVIQDAPSNVAADPYTVTVLGPTQGVKQIGKNNLGLPPNSAANLPQLERIVVEGLAGDDNIRVGHDDEYGDLDAFNGVPGQSIPFEVRGDSPNASDRLVVPDDGLGDLIIQRQGADQRSGSITVGPLAPIDYSEIEFVNVTPLDAITAGTGTDLEGRLVVFKNDPFESNNTLPNATFLGSGPTINVDPTIDPGGIPEFGVPGDNDFYQFVAQETGTLDLQLYFEPITTLANGRPGLPADGELLVTVLDSDGVPVAIATASDLLDPNTIKIGERVTVPVVRNNTYYLRVEGEAGGAGASGINVYNFTAITTAAPIPELVDLQAASDSGRNDTDDITKITTPTFNIILDDDRIDEFMNIDLNPDTVNDDAQTLNDGGGNRIDYGVEVFNNAVSIGFAYFTGVGNTWEFTATAGDLNEGDFNHISAAVWIRDVADPAQVGRHELSPSLQVTLDTIAPPGFFGLPDAQNTLDGLAASSDTGVLTVPATFDDRATSDTTPTLWGRAEANTIVSVYYDADNDGVIDLTGADADIFLGQTVATPIDGNLAFANGYWELTSALDLNEIIDTRDGIRRLLMSAEDVAGNPMPMDIGAADPTGADAGNEINENVDELYIFIDTQGPQVANVRVPADLTYPLFDPKPSQDGYTPLVNSLRIDFQDLPNRFDQLVGADNDFLYEALVEGIAETAGNYLLVGDHVGTIDITSAVLTNFARSDGNPATAFVTLNFAQPLPDDRFTLTISDSLVDPVGNNLDGESGANEPEDNPTFPTGDGIPGADFIGRFTVDSRPEIGSYVAQNIDIDINGNFIWDPSSGQVGTDATNVDLTFNMNVADPATGAIAPGGFSTHDLAFAGKFTNGNAPASGRLFDMLAVYGWSVELGGKRWLIDTNSDGVVNTADGDIISLQPAIANINVNASVPVAGNFDGNVANGDEIGLYNAGLWALDSNRNFVIDAGDTFLNGNMLGHPVVGDFDGNGEDDLAVFNDNTLYFDMNVAGFDGFTDDTFIWGFPGVLDRPVAADMDWDGIDDIGLWVPRNSAQANRPIAEWYFLVSGNPNIATRNAAAGTANLIDHPFETVPFGNDLYAEFGDELALPIVGNFDPPVVADDEPTNQNVAEPGDFDQDGDVDGQDFLAMQRGYGTTANASISDGDGNGDGAVDGQDMNLWAAGIQARIAMASDFNGDGWVNDADVAMWEGDYGSSTAGDVVNGADFLALQRSYSHSTSAAVSAGSSSGGSAATTAAVSLESTIDDSLAGIAAYGPSSAAAVEAAFEELEEVVVEYVDDNNQFSASVSGGQSSASTDVGSPVSDAEDAVDSLFGEDDDLLATLSAI